MLNRIRALTVCGSLALLASFVASATTHSLAHDAATVAVHFNLERDGLALQGYDPVAYFSGRAAKGRADVAAEHAGAVYRFASEANRAAFTASPEQYEPAYGGWCATAMAEGKKVKIDPKNYKVTRGRLFVFYKSFFHDARADWIKDESNLRARADAQWRRIAGE